METRTHSLLTDQGKSISKKTITFASLRRLFLGKALLLHPGYRIYIVRIPKELGGGPYTDSELKSCKIGILNDFDNI